MQTRSRLIETSTPGRTVSTSTEFHAKLTQLDETTVAVESTESYTFDPLLDTHSFVVYVTCNPIVRDLVVSGSMSPLWELHFGLDDKIFVKQFLPYVNNLLATIKVAFTYQGAEGTSVPVRMQPVKLHEVSIENWDRYLRFFEPHSDNVLAVEKSEMYHQLRIFECDLSAIAPDMQHIEKFAIRATSQHPLDDGLLTMYAPFSCMTSRIGFDVSGMAQPGRLFQTLPSTMRKIEPSGWRTAEELAPVEIDSWVLAGQGVTLVWVDKTSLDPS